MTNPYLDPSSQPVDPAHPHVDPVYLPPAMAHQPQWQAGQGPYHDDPLVNPASAGINGWFNRLGQLFKRSWQSTAAIFALTHLLPGLVLGVAAAAAALFASVYFLDRLQEQAGNDMITSPEPAYGNEVLGWGLGMVVVVLIVVLVMLLLQSVGYAAATYAVTRQAAGIRVGIGEALRYGLRRGPALFGWQLLVGLCVIAGLLACVLPGFYIYAATALFGPILIFERRNPISRSFSIFHKDFGRVLGRLALLLVATIAGAIISSVFTGAIEMLAPTSLEDLGAHLTLAAAQGLISTIIELPITMIVFAGILLTYTEQRGHEGPTTTATLNGELL